MSSDMNRLHRALVSTGAVVYVSLALCWSSGLGRSLPRPARFLFENLGMAQSWPMFARLRPMQGLDLERIQAETHLSNGKTAEWSYPITDWRTPLEAERSERFANFSVALFGPQGPLWRRQLARYVARQAAGDGRSAQAISVDLVYPAHPGATELFLLKDFRDLR